MAAAVLTEPDTAKAATQAPGAAMTYFSMPVEKWEDTREINPVDGTPDLEIWGKVTDGSLDSDLQIVDPDWSLEAIKTWYDTKANIRLGHDPKRPVGRGVEVDGHYVKGLIADPVAKHLVRSRVLNDWSVGIMNPDIRKGDPKFRHLDPAGKAVNGVITGRDDGLSQIGEISVVDRGSNFGTAFQLVKAAADGTPEWVGELTAPDDVIAKVAAPARGKTVTVELPRNMSLSVKPSDLAKLATFRQKLAAEQGDAAKAAAPDAVKATAPAAAPKAAIPHEVLDEALDDALKALGAAEDAVLGKGSRTFTAAQRREHASAGVALPDGSYPMPDADAVRRAAILIRSKHGDWKAAARLLARRVKALGIPNPLKKKPDAGKTAKTAGPAVEKKQKVMCGHCGARQNAKHVHCPECGGTLVPGAMPITKNHDFTCLGCGKDLDKGERHCPQCGKENPGYLPEADHKIPANADKAAKERVSKKAKGKKAGKGKAKGEPFGGSQAPPFGAKDDNARSDGKDDGGEKCKTAAPATVQKRKGKGKGRSPAKGVKGHEGTTAPLPPHREPDGMPIEEFEKATALGDGDESTEMAAALRMKSLGIDRDLGALHDLCCPAFAPADVSKAFPHATFAGIDTMEWQRKALDAAASSDMATAMTRWNEMSGLSLAAVTLKTADPRVLHDLRLEAHKAFRDANPGPASFPTPSHPMPQQFQRPYIAAGHGAASPQHDGPHSFGVPRGQIQAQDYTRGYLTDGRAADSPGNATPRHDPPPAPMTGGQPENIHYQGSMRDNAAQAISAMHDHVSRLFPDVCPMSPEMGHTQKPAPPVPAAVGGPEPHAGKTAKAAKAKARKAARTASRKQAAKLRKLGAQVLKGTMTAEDARVKLGITGPAPATAPVEPPPVSQAEPDALKSAVAAATRPLFKQLKTQDKALRKLAKVTAAIADQPDTTAAPFRGVTAVKSASGAPAGPRNAAESAELAQTARLQLLHSEWRNSPDPDTREAAYRAMTTQLGLNSMTPSRPMT